MSSARAHSRFHGPLPRMARLVVQALFWLLAGYVVVYLPLANYHANFFTMMGLYSPGWFMAAGRALGWAAAGALAVQFVLAPRVPLLDGAFGLDRLYRMHRWFGIAAVVLATAHPMVYFAASTQTLSVDGGLGLDTWPGMWPELLGAVALVSLWSAALVALYRAYVRLDWELWARMHKVGVASIGVMVLVHGYFVGVRAGSPELGAFHLCIAAGLALWGGLEVWRRYTLPAATITAIEQLEGEAYRLEVAGPRLPGYFPGQFALVEFDGEHVAPERHPWTIAESPARAVRDDGTPVYRFTIRCSGDFTATIGRVRPGDGVRVEGPYGLFSHVARAPQAPELVLVAGGVGITPMLAMLRHMQDAQENTPTRLIWTNRTPAEAVHLQELRTLAADAEWFTLHEVYTRLSESPQGCGVCHLGRLDHDRLRRLLDDVDRRAHCFVCGPPPLMEMVRGSLAGMGFARRHIHAEAFAL